MSFFAAPNVINILLSIVAFSSFTVGTLLIRKRGRRAKTLRLFGLTAISIGFWVIGRALLQLSPPEGLAHYFAYYLFIPPVFIALFLFLFSYFIGEERKTVSVKKWAALLGPWAFLLLFTLTPNATSLDVIQSSAGFNEIIYGPYFFYVYLPILAGYLLGIFPILIRKYKHAHQDLQIRLRYIIFGSFISIITGIGANLLLPLFGVTNLVWLGPLVGIVVVGLVGYALLRRDLWDFKLVVTEFVVFVVLIFLVVDVFLAAEDPGRVMFKSIAFLLMSVFSYFLIRGIFKEIEARDKVSHLTEELENANIRLREIDAEKSMFVSVASHQLRSPLTLIKGYASMLLEGSFGKIENPVHRNIIEKIFEASERLVGMIEDFLDITRIEQGRMSYRFSKIDLGELIMSVITELRAAIVEGATRVVTHFPTEEKYYMVGDSLKIRQVITNLIDNAIKYSPKYTTIDIYLKKEGGKLIVSVHDQGVGIEKEVLSRLFEKYSRAEESQKLHTEGRGLGLYVAKQIVAAHGGKIWVRSHGKGKGSIFYVQFKEFSSGRRVEFPPLIEESRT